MSLNGHTCTDGSPVVVAFGRREASCRSYFFTGAPRGCISQGMQLPLIEPSQLVRNKPDIHDREVMGEAPGNIRSVL